MNKMGSTSRVLVAIPVHNEEATIQKVVEKTREAVPMFDLLVVDDGSIDGTGAILQDLGVVTAKHACNLGYSRAFETAIQYAQQVHYDTLIVLDADGQHDPGELQRLYEDSFRQKCDVLIGSRYVDTRKHTYAISGRGAGTFLFSILVKLITGQRIYDTTSGLKVIHSSAFEPLTRWHFVDFHAEAIVYLLRLGYRVAESPITVSERTQGRSMYSAISIVLYPLGTFIMLTLGIIEAALTRRRT